jgi:hypothetical protein
VGERSDAGSFVVTCVVITVTATAAEVAVVAVVVAATLSCVTIGLSDHTIFWVHQQSVGAQLDDPFVGWKVHIILTERVRQGHGYLPQANHDEDGEKEDNWG